MVCNFAMILILTVGLGTVSLNLANAFVVKIGFPDGATGSAATIYAAGMTSIDSILKLLVVFGLTVLLMLQVPSIAAALGGGIALATQGIVSSTMNVMRPASIRHNAQQVQRELRSVRNAAGKGTQAFKKTFARGNSITGS
jgi:type IV secretion system protein VirB6